MKLRIMVHFFLLNIATASKGSTFIRTKCPVFAERTKPITKQVVSFTQSRKSGKKKIKS